MRRMSYNVSLGRISCFPTWGLYFYIYIYIYILISLENNLGYYSHKNYSKRGYKFVATFNVHFVTKKSKWFFPQNLSILVKNMDLNSLHLQLKFIKTIKIMSSWEAYTLQNPQIGCHCKLASTKWIFMLP